MKRGIGICREANGFDQLTKSFDLLGHRLAGTAELEKPASLFLQQNAAQRAIWRRSMVLLVDYMWFGDGVGHNLVIVTMTTSTAGQ